MKTIDRINFGEKDYQDHIAFWQGHLLAHPHGFTFQQAETRRPGTGSTDHAPEAFRFTLSGTSRRHLAALTQESDTALLVCLLSAWGILLRTYTGQRQVIIASPVLPLEDNEEQVNRRVPLFVAVKAGDSVQGLLNAVQETVRACYTYQNYPLSLLATDPQQPVLPSNVLLRYNRIHEMTAETGPYDLVIDLEREQDEMTVQVRYRPAAFESGFIRRMAGHLEQAIAGLTDLEKAVDAIDILTAAELQQLESFNATARAYRDQATIHQLFEEQAARTPGHVAVRYRSTALTYTQLNESANRLAHFLREDYGVQPGEVVGVLSDRSDLLIAGLLGIMKAGGVYLPIDAAYPDDRIAHIIRDAGVKYLLVHSQYFPKLSQFYEIPMVALDFQLATLETSAANPAPVATAADAAYMIYTSGSTGQPKGVLLGHQGFVNMIQDQINVFGVRPSDAVVQFASASFDASLSEIFMALLQGASLVMVDPQVITSTEAMLACMKGNGVTVATFPPSYLSTLPPGELRFLRVIISAGEAAQVASLTQCAEFARCFNAYGPTECSVCVSICPVTPADHVRASLPVGRPIANVQAYVLNEQLARVPVGVTGGLYVAGPGLAKGYMNARELTEAQFIPNPFGPGRLYKTGDAARWTEEGLLAFAGRQDEQLKLRGYRIEPGEIAAVLSRHAGVQETYVTKGKGEELLAVVVPHRQLASALHGLAKNQLRRKPLPVLTLPNGMVIFGRHADEPAALFEKVFVEKAYAQGGLRLPQGAVLVDVGAGTGMFSLYAGLQLPDARIFAFEPVPETFQLLSENVALYDLPVKTFNAGLAGAAEVVSYVHAPGNPARSDGAQPGAGPSPGPAGQRVEARGAAGEGIAVQMRRLSDVMREEGLAKVDLLKVDAGKGGMDVFAGIDAEDWAKIQQVVVDVPDDPDGVAALEALFRAKGFGVTVGEAGGLPNTGLRSVAGIRAGYAATDQVRPVAFNAGPAGRWTSEEALVESLRQWISGKLPEYMLPARIRLAEQLPLTPNGKVDKKALLDRIEQQEQVQYAAPRNEMEKMVAAVWQSALGIGKISIYDNFFALGGDSIKGIQIVSRIYKAGYKATLQDLFRHPVIAEFAALVQTTTVAIDQAPVTGPVPLSPVQTTFFAHTLRRPHHFNHAVMLDIPERLAPEAIEAIFGKIQEHHDSLRLRFNVTGDQVYQESAGTQLPLGLERHDLRGWDEQAQGVSAAARLEFLANGLQAGIDLAGGPLMKLGHFHLDDGDRLLVVIHHLVVDTVSWRILSEDIESLYQQYKNGETLSLPPKTHSFKAWSEALSRYAQGEALAKEMPYWQAVAARMPEPLPGDLDGDNRLRDIGFLSFTLPKAATGQLLTRVNEAFHTEISDLLLTALAMAYQRAFGRNRLGILLEGHGREDILPDMNVSRTVGWFTSIFPVVLEVEEQVEPGRQLKTVKETLRQVPRKGIGYEIGKHLAAGEHRRLLAESATPQVSFNYLGQFDADLAGFSFEIAREGSGHTQDPDDKRLGQLEFSGMVSNGQLTISLAYGRRQFLPQTMSRWLKHYEEALLALIAYCVAREKSSFTPSDFTYRGLSLEMVEQLEARYALEDVYPLSPMQEGMLFQGMLDHSSSSYFDQTAYRIHGPMNPVFVEMSLNDLLRRHAVLRTAFVHDLPGRPVQIVLTDKQAAFRFEDIRHRGDAAAIGQYVRAYKQEARRHALHFGGGALFEVTMLQVGDAEYEFVWTYHHILMDGWCIRILVAEFTELYYSYHEGRLSQLLPVQPYSTFIDWLEQQDRETPGQYWAEYLAGYATPAGVPRLKAVSPQPPEDVKKQLFVRFDPQRTGRLTALAGDHQVTINNVVQAVWGVLLSKYNHSRDVVFGTVVSGRPSQIPGVESMVGLFINAVPVRVRYDDEDRFDTLLKTVQAQAVAGERYHYYPLAEVQARSVMKQGLIDHLLTFENYPVAEEIEGLIGDNRQAGTGVDLEISNVEVHDENHYDFNILFALGAELTLKLEYTQAYHPAFIEGVARHFSHILDQVLANPSVRIASLEVLTDAEKQKVLEEFSTVATEYPRNSSIQQLFEQQAAQRPEATAVVFEGTALTYRALNEKANALARCLRESYAVGANDFVGLLADRSERFIVGLLGILKAGGAYAPIDPSYPKERIRLVLEDVQPKVLLTQSDYLGEIDYYPGQVFALDIQLDALDPVAENPAPAAGPDNLAYVLYTSGSTGKPKGVLVNHRAVVRLVRNTNYIQLTPGLKLLQTGALAFDASTFEIWGMLLNGGELHLLPQSRLLDIHALKAAMWERGITTMWFTSSWFNQLADLDPDLFGRLKHLLVGGEKLSPEHINRIRRAHPGLQVINGYGPTENTTFSICYPIDEAFETSIPLGRPIANTSVYVLDARMQPVPVGIEGEIYLGGDGLAQGYLNQEVLTAEKFVAHPWAPGERLYRTGDIGKWLPDGKVEYAGRRDEQLKVRGYRIEPGEIAHALKQHAGVQDVHIQLVQEEHAEASLAAVLIPRADTAYTVRQLAALRRQRPGLSTFVLPNRMVVAQNNRSETEFLFKEIFEEHTYNKHGVEVKPGDVIFDVGANIGMFSLFAGLHYPGVQVFAFEPVKPTFDTLSANAALYPVGIKAFHCGLSNQDQQVRFAHYPYNTVMSGRYASDKSVDKDILVGYFNKQQEDEREKVTTEQISEMLEERMQVEYYDCRLRRLSDIIREEGVERIDLLKVDVEKSELDVLSGIDEADWAKIQQVSMEIHDIDGTLRTIEDLLARHGFSCYVEQEDTLVETHLYNIYATKKGVAGKTDQPLPSRLVFDTPGNWTTSEGLLKDLKAHCEQQLPAYMVPSDFYVVDHFPLTENGKVDAKQLIALGRQHVPAAGGYAAPADATEQTLAEIWQEVLGKAEIGVHTNFFEIGGHSLKAIQVVAHVAKRLNTKLELGSIFATPTIAELAREIRRSEKAAYEQIQPLEPQPHYGLSYAQRRLWLACQFEHENVAYNMPGAMRLEGELNRAAFEQALAAVVDRHESLRTTFSLVDGEPRQQIHLREALGIDLAYEDLRGSADPGGRVQERVEAEASTPFNLEKGPLLRARLLQPGPDAYVFLFTMHHLVADGRSLEVMTGDFLAAYQAFDRGQPNPLPALRIHYKDFAAWHNAQVSEEKLVPHRRYWQEQLAGPLPVLALPTDFPRPAVKTTHGKLVPFAVEAAVSRGLSRLAQEHGSSLFVLLQASLKALLFCYTRQEDLIIGSPITGREHLDLDDQIGYYLNTLALRTRFRADDAFATLLEKVKSATRQAYQHQVYPFDRLLNDLNVQWDRSRNPLFDVGFNLNQEEAQPEREQAFGNVEVSSLSREFGTVKADLWLNAFDGTHGVRFSLEYNTDLFKPAFIETLLANYQFLLATVVENPAIRLAELAAAMDVHQAQFLQSRQQTAASSNLAQLLNLKTVSRL